MKYYTKRNSIGNSKMKINTPYRLLVSTKELKEVLFGFPLPENMEILNERWTASYLTSEEYNRQIMKPDSFGIAPILD